MTMLVTWMIELYLNQLGELKEQGQDDTHEYENTQEEFRKFLMQQKVKASRAFENVRHLCSCML